MAFNFFRLADISSHLPKGFCVFLASDSWIFLPKNHDLLPGGVVALYHIGHGHAFTRSPKGLGLLGGGEGCLEIYLENNE